MSYTKKLLVSSALAFACLSQVAVGSQTQILTLTEAEGLRHQTRLVQQQENVSLQELPQGFSKAASTHPLSAWGLVSAFVTSFFQPFIDDAPRVIAAVKEQRDELVQQGVQEYASNAAIKVGEFVMENPLDTVMLVGSAALGWNVGDATLVPLAVYSASGLKNAQTMCSFAHSMGSDKELLKLGIYGLAFVYAASTIVPAVDAALAPTLGTQFQVNSVGTTAGVTSLASLLDANGVPTGSLVGVWEDSVATNVKGRIFSPDGTMVTNEFQVNTNDVITTSPLPVVAALPSGFSIVWSQDTLSILARHYFNNGTAVTSPFSVSQNTTGYGSFGNPYVGNLNGNALFAWGGSSLSSPSSDTLIDVFSLNGALVANQAKLNVANGAGSPSVISLPNGQALVTWFGASPNSLNGRFVASDGAPSGNEFVINQTAISSDNAAKGAGLVGNTAAVPYETAGGNKVRIVTNPTSLGSELSIAADRGDGATLASLNPNGGFLAVWGSSGGVGGTLQGKAFDATGNAQTSSFTVSSVNPQVGSISAASLPGDEVGVLFQNKTGPQVLFTSVSFSPAPPTPTPTPTPPTPTPTPTPTPHSASAVLSPSSWFAMLPVVGAYLANRG